MAVLTHPGPHLPLEIFKVLCLIISLLVVCVCLCSLCAGL